MRDSWTQAIGEYTTALAAARRSPGTVRLHRHYLRQLAAGHRSPWTVTTGQLRTFLAAHRDGGWSAETQKSARGAFVGFYRWAHGEGHIEADPTAGLKSITVPVGVPRPAPEAVLKRALAIADSRERLMLLLAAYAGLRCSEIARVHAEDLDDGILYVIGKGEKERIIPVEHPEILAAFGRGDGYLFPGPKGHLTAGTVTKLLSNVLEGDWTGHKLRHRFATRSHEHNPDLLALGRVMGHSRPETTLRYVQLSRASLFAVVRGAA